MVKVRAGTSGYSYKEWKGPFYPEKTKNADMLSYYATQLPTVEINNTFYRMPKEAVIEKWAADVPDDFIFIIKASRRITHMQRLREAGDSVEFLFRVISKLENKLGPVLFQLPPFLKKDIERLKSFLDVLPNDRRVAFEFRHESWADDEVHAALADAGAALCFADTKDDDEEVVTKTASFGYLRLRRPDYSDADLAQWAKTVREQDWQEAFVFFKHEDEGAGPKMAARFLDLFKEEPS